MMDNVSRVCIEELASGIDAIEQEAPKSWANKFWASAGGCVSPCSIRLSALQQCVCMQLCCALVQDPASTCYAVAIAPVTNTPGKGRS